MDSGRIDMRKVIRKAKVNGFEASSALDKLGTVFHNVMHDVHG